MQRGDLAGAEPAPLAGLPGSVSSSEGDQTATGSGTSAGLGAAQTGFLSSLMGVNSGRGRKGRGPGARANGRAGRESPALAPASTSGLSSSSSSSPSSVLMQSSAKVVQAAAAGAGARARNRKLRGAGARPAQAHLAATRARDAMHGSASTPQMAPPAPPRATPESRSTPGASHGGARHDHHSQFGAPIVDLDQQEHFPRFASHRSEHRVRHGNGATWPPVGGQGMVIGMGMGMGQMPLPPAPGFQGPGGPAALYAWAQSLRPSADVPYGSVGPEDDPDGVIDPGPGGGRAAHNRAILSKGKAEKLVPPFYNYAAYGTNAEVLAGLAGKSSDRTGDQFDTPKQADPAAPSKVGEGGSPDEQGYAPPQTEAEKKNKKPVGLPVHPDYTDVSSGRLDMLS